jgi:outer membrane lipoprotein-sorting protein
MKKIAYLFIVTLIILASTITTYAQAISKEEILENYFKVIGQDIRVEVQTVVATGVTIQNSHETSFRQIQKRPDKAYQEILLPTGDIIKQGFDGVNGWMLASWMNTAEPVTLTGPDLKTIQEVGDIDGDLWNWNEKGHKLTYSGVKDYGDKKVHLLRLMKTDGDTDELFIGTDDYFLHKMNRITNINDSPVTVEVLFSDYREADGIMMPFKVEQRFNEMQGMVVEFQEIKFNMDVDDKMFTRPE